MTSRAAFQRSTSVTSRSNESRRMRERYPDRVPALVFAAPSLDLRRHKYLVPRDTTVGQFLFVIRKRLKLAPDQALFLFTESNTLPPTATTIHDAYEQHANEEDGFLYFHLCKESTFG